MKRTQTKARPHGVYVVEGEGDNAFWTRVGAARPHKSGGGFNITLSAMPVNGRLVVREPKPAEGKEAAMSAASAKRFLVRAYDHDLIEVVVEAVDCDDAIGQAERMYLTDASADVDRCSPPQDLRWHAVPVHADKPV